MPLGETRSASLKLPHSAAGTLAIWSRDGCEDSRKFVSGTPPKLVNWLTRLVNWAESLTGRGLWPG